MNEFKAFAEKRFNGWVAMVRFAHDGGAHPVLDKGGIPMLFHTKSDAELVAHRRLVAYFNGNLVAYDNVNVRDVRREKAEALFTKKRANG